ncbi:MAG: CotH kinase family protein [Bacteroidota bacterium]
MKTPSVLLLLLLTLHLCAQDNGNLMFDESYVHEIRVTFTDSNFFEILEENYDLLFDTGERIYLMADVEIDGIAVDSIGFRQKGFFSNWGIFDKSVKKPFKIDFNEFVSGKKYDGLKKLNLQNAFLDPSFMRDALSYKLMRDVGIPAPRSSFARVYLNDEYWGLYIAVEQIDNKFLKNHFDDNDGNLFKCTNGTDLLYQGDDPLEYMDEFELKTNEEENDWSGFIEMVEVFNAEQAIFSDAVSEHFNLAGFSRVVAADMILTNWDSYHSNGRNFYLYEDPSTQVFHWLPWDYNLSISNFGTTLEFGANNIDSPNPLSDNFFGDPTLRAAYYEDVCDLLQTTFNLAHVAPYVDAQRELISEAVDEDVNKFFSTDAFVQNIDESYETFFGPTPGIKSYFEARVPEVLSQLEAVGYSCVATSTDEVAAQGMNLYPNPSTGQVIIEHSEEGEYLEVYAITGALLHSVAIRGRQTSLDLSHLSPGIYLVSMGGSVGRYTGKLQIK